MTLVESSGLPLLALVETIKARVVAGNRDMRRSDDHHKAAGIHLLELERRLPTEEPDAYWPTWVAKTFPQIGYSRIEQLKSIGRGDTTQAEIRGATAASMRASYTPAPRFDPPPRDASPDVSRPASDNERQRKRRKRLRSIRVEAGADIAPPLAPIEHRRLLKEYRDIGARLGIDDLRTAVAMLRERFPG